MEGKGLDGQGSNVGCWPLGESMVPAQITCQLLQNPSELEVSSQAWGSKNSVHWQGLGWFVVRGSRAKCT